MGDGFQHAFVDAFFRSDVAFAPRNIACPRILLEGENLAVPFSHADRVDLDSQRLGHIGGTHRGHEACVVATVGQEHHHLGLGFGFLETGKCVHQAIANGGSAVHDGIAGEVVGCLEDFKQRTIIECERALRNGAGSESGKADSVAMTLLDKVCNHLLGVT